MNSILAEPCKKSTPTLDLGPLQNVEVTMFNNCKSTEPRVTRLDAILADIRDGRYASEVDRLRQLRSRDEDVYAEKKKTALPAFSVSGKIANRAKGASQMAVYSNVMQIDLDDLFDVASIREQLKSDPFILFIFTSPSGEGLKLGIRIDGTRHDESFAAVKIYLYSNYGVQVDQTVSSEFSLCLVSHDSQLWVNPDVAVFPLEQSQGTGNHLRSLTLTQLTTFTTSQLKPLILSEDEKAAVSECVPTKRHQNHRLLFELARAAKGLEKRRVTQPERFEAMFNYWHELAVEFLRPGQSRDCYFFEFLDALECVRYPLGEGIIEMAFANAQAEETPPEAIRFESPQLRVFVCFCREMQRLVGERAFFLSVRTVQDLFQLGHPMEASRWLSGLCRVGILKLVKRGRKHVAGTRGEPNEFRYLLPITSPNPKPNEPKEYLV
jgi:hypothetical protein